MPPVLSPTPETLLTTAWSDYALLDSGNGRKLERYGPYTVVRPEPQCWWSPRAPEAFANPDAVFDPDDEDEAGRWRFVGKPIETFPLSWGDARFTGRFTPFRHLAFSRSRQRTGSGLIAGSAKRRPRIPPPPGS
jgi:23S rRNA (cytosine1962-C5)-methyltransferase